ncbi:MAG: 3-methyl-2-oxobutanoate hydroxymethyltransferase [Planctomycetota bacterium]
MAKPTIHSLYKAQKNGTAHAQVYAGSLDEARAAGEAEVGLMVCSKHDVQAFRAVAPNTFIIAALGINDPAIVSAEQAIAAGFESMRCGADAVYTGMGLGCVEAMADESIPVFGHVGLVPYRASWVGGMRAIGRTADEAADVYRSAKAYEDAGAVGVEMEVVPSRVAETIAERTNLLIVSMGSGTAGVSQYLFSTDVLGTNTGHVPRHAKVYADLHAAEQRVHELRVEAMKTFKAEVSDGTYPEEKHTLTIKDEEFDKFLGLID